MERTCGCACVVAVCTEGATTEASAGVGVGIGLAEAAATETTAKRHGGGCITVAMGGCGLLRRSRKMTRQTREEGVAGVLFARRYDGGSD